MIAIVSGSLNPDSRSRLLAAEARRALERDGLAVKWLDLREVPLPLCDGGAAAEHPGVRLAGEVLRPAQGILLATPIYNFDASAAVKNLVELTGDAWEDKVVGFLCAAGGMSSYMSVLSLANSLMLDFRSVIVPRFVYATGEAFQGDRIVDPDIRRRVGELARLVGRLALALTPSAVAARAVQA